MNLRSLLALTLPLSLVAVACDGDAPPPVAPPQPSATPAAPPAPPTAEATQEAPKLEPKPEREHHGPPHWTYAGEEGAPKWGDLHADFATCKTGVSQSPIDIVTKKAAAEKSLLPIEANYKAKLPLAILNNGHTVQVNNGTDATLKSDGQLWKLAQFHFHSPSEHALDGKLLDLELHLVHKNDKGELAVVGLLFKKGKENKLLAPVLDHAPKDVTADPKTVDGVAVDLSKLIPAKSKYYAYSGSLTTPPCSEGVRWHVLATVGEISEAQLAKFREATHGDTNRPVQPLGSRKVGRLP